MSFAVAVPTVGRTIELATLLQSIDESTVRPAQIVVIDQNCDDRLVPIIAQFPALGVEHHQVRFNGLSAAKNYAARVVTADVIFTPDDDCRVFPDTFRTALEELAVTGADAVFGRCLDETGRDAIVAYRHDAGWLSQRQMDGMFVEPAMAIRTAMLREFPFDETLGAGMFHGAEEGSDLVFRLLVAEKRLYFQPNVIFYHPRTVKDHASSAALRRVFSYRCGYGRLCSKHGFWTKYVRRLAIVTGAILVYAIGDRRRARYYIAELAGLIAGVVVPPC